MAADRFEGGRELREPAPAPEGRRREVLLAGEGGQGLVVAGIVLGEAAVLEGLEAVQAQWVFGSAARGSLSRSEVVISASEVAFPRVRRAEIFLALTQTALEKNLSLLAHDAKVIADTDGVTDRAGLGSEQALYRLPLLRTANRLGLGRSTNMFALGVVVALSGVVRPESVEQAIARRFGSKAEINVEAFRKGLELAAGVA